MSADLASARARAKASRAELQATVQELQGRLRPASLAGEAMETIRRKGEHVADDAAAAVRDRPVAAGAVAAGIGALIGARLLWRRRNQGDDT